MPVYNCEKYIAQSINSIIFQTYQNWELLICDDCSSDSTYNIISHFKDTRLRVFRNETNIGSLQSRNLLLKEARGEYIAFQDADDYSDPERISSQIAMLEDSDLALCGTWGRYFIKNKTVSIKRTPQDWSDIKLILKTKNPFCSASIMFKRKILDEIGVFREYFSDKGNYDYDFTSRIAQKYPSCNIQECLYHVRVLPNSNSRRIKDDNPIKLESHKIVQFLIKEREKNERDSIMNGNRALLNKIERDLIKPYNENRILAFDRQINEMMDSKLYFSAINLSIIVVLTQKFSIKSIHLFLYSIKRLFKTI